MNNNIIVHKILPNIENPAKIRDTFRLVLPSLKYVINAAPDEIRMIKVDVSIASFMGIKKNNVKNPTKKTPPPIPAILEITPTINPKMNRTRRIVVGSIAVMNAANIAAATNLGGNIANYFQSQPSGGLGAWADAGDVGAAGSQNLWGEEF